MCKSRQTPGVAFTDSILINVSGALTQHQRTMDVAVSSVKKKKEEEKKKETKKEEKKKEKNVKSKREEVAFQSV